MVHCAKKLFVLVAVTWLAVQADLQEGSDCKFEDGSPGKCAKLTDCAPVLRNLLRGQKPDFCIPPADDVPIVCCDEKPIVFNDEPVKNEELTSPNIETEPVPPGQRISDKKCQEYSTYVYKRVPSYIPGEFEERNLCETTAGAPFIVNGEPAGEREFPHMAAVGYDTRKGREWNCGGSLISERFVLTAGHCIVKYPDTSLPLVVRLGQINITNNKDVQEIPVKAVHEYPGYKYPKKYHDIGLIELERNAYFDAYVRPACLQTERDKYPIIGTVTGWGKIDYLQFRKAAGGAWISNLLKVLVRQSSSEVCSAKHPPTSKLEKGIVDDWMLCFGDEETSNDSCKGDSGGPLQYVQETPYCMYAVFGIVSFGSQCGQKGVPAIYTRVSHYVPWIEKIVWPEKL